MTAPAMEQPKQFDMARFDARRQEIAEELSAAKKRRDALRERVNNASLREDFYGSASPADLVRLRAELADVDRDVVRLEGLWAAASNIGNEIRVEAAVAALEAAVRAAPVHLEAWETKVALLLEQLVGVVRTLDELEDIERGYVALGADSAVRLLGLRYAGLPPMVIGQERNLVEAVKAIGSLVSRRRDSSMGALAATTLTRARHGWAAASKERERAKRELLPGLVAAANAVLAGVRAGRA